MKLTVAICTWNRADLLDQTLAQMRRLEVPAGVSWELLVVNNNCTDHTDAVLARHAAHLPLRRLFEPAQGLSAARNRAVAEARGDLIIWTDDDVLTDPCWLVEYARAAREWPEAGYFGGTVDPWFESPPPRWVRQNMDILCGTMVVRQLGDFVGPLPERQFPFGANMAIRRSYLTGRPFDTRLGYNGGRLVCGEETAIFLRLRDEGVPGVWVGTARVRHFIPRRRMTTRFVSDWFAGFGQADVRLENPPAGRTLCGRPLWAVRTWAVHRLRSLLAAPVSGRTWLRHYARAAVAAGVMREFAARRRAAGRPAAPATGVREPHTLVTQVSR